MKKNNKISLPTNVGQQVKFPGTNIVCLAREFSVKPNGDIEISPWLSSQANRHCPDVHNLTGTRFMKRAIAWFVNERVKHNPKRRHIPKGSVGLVNVGLELEAQLAHAGIRI